MEGLADGRLNNQGGGSILYATKSNSTYNQHIMKVRQEIKNNESLKKRILHMSELELKSYLGKNLSPIYPQFSHEKLL